jgi:hypothetical protein
MLFMRLQNTWLLASMRLAIHRTRHAILIGYANANAKQFSAESGCRASGLLNRNMLMKGSTQGHSSLNHNHELSEQVSS